MQNFSMASGRQQQQSSLSASHAKVIPSPVSSSEDSHQGSTSLSQVNPPNSPAKVSKQASVLTGEEVAQYKALLVGEARLDAHLRQMIVEALWAVGCEPETMQSIMKSLDSTAALTLFHNELIANGVGIEELTKKLTYFRKMDRLPLRPEGPEDPFKLQSMWPFFTTRLVTCFIPFLAYFTAHLYIPQSNEREKSLLEISKTFSVILTIAYLLWWVNVCLIVAGTISSVSMIDCAVMFLTYFIFVASQVAREAQYWSEEGRRIESAYQFERFLLHYTDEFTSELGVKISGYDVLFRMMAHTGQLDSQSSVLEAPAVHAYARSQTRQHLQGGWRRQSSMRQELELLKAGLAEQAKTKQDKEDEFYSNRYAIYKVKTFSKLYPFLASIIAAFTPSVFRHFLPEERSLFDGLDSSETIGQIIEIILIFMYVNCYNLVILGTAQKDVSALRHFAIWIEGSLKDQYQMETLRLRLYSRENVGAFRTIHRLVFSVYASYSEYHLASFQVSSIIAIFASALVFALAIMDVSFLVAMALLFLIGTEVTIIMTYVFYNTAKTHTILVNSVNRGLHAQIRKNVIEIDFLETLAKTRGADRAAEIEELSKANMMIHHLIIEIKDEHRPLKLWGFLPLTKDNIIKLAGALAASLFTTALRVAL
eukprot:CAMPEP_0118637956 /NCGR_PEP_ID=MMETSP0785-20121206/3428_1 /TAXON_ID=91992 /ORGANISM="Bolidomonas pacifica, Strain CCMP 1866" /LENGTH=650 /DNA_ID=CAMNT_0006529175 /DNA_START=51 /DNA_END=2000 /DNA_ORIENTATION=+